MTTVIIHRNHQNKIVFFSLKDHTGFGEAGNDMVCAVLSTASQFAVLGLEEIVKLEDFSYTIAEGFLECQLPETLSVQVREKADVLLETMVLVLKQAEEQFPSYLKIEESEV